MPTFVIVDQCWNKATLFCRTLNFQFQIRPYCFLYVGLFTAVFFYFLAVVKLYFFVSFSKSKCPLPPLINYYANQLIKSDDFDQVKLLWKTQCLPLMVQLKSMLDVSILCGKYIATTNHLFIHCYTVFVVSFHDSQLNLRSLKIRFLIYFVAVFNKFITDIFNLDVNINNIWPGGNTQFLIFGLCLFIVYCSAISM